MTNKFYAITDFLYITVGLGYWACCCSSSSSSLSDLHLMKISVAVIAMQTEPTIARI